MPATGLLPPSTETGKLQVMHLKRYWNKSLLKREGKLAPGSMQEEWVTDTTLLTILGLGLEQTMRYVYNETPSFEEFENWIVGVSGKPDAEKISKFNRLFTGDSITGSAIELDDVLTKDDLDFWGQNGYVIVRKAINNEDANQTVEAICKHLEINRYDSSTWYNDHPSKQGIMVQLFQHPLLE